MDLDRLRELIRESINQNAFKTAIFWADKVASMSSDPYDIYWLAQCYFKTRQYSRVFAVLKNNQLIEKSISCRYLAAQCLFEQKDFDLCLEILGEKEKNRIPKKQPTLEDPIETPEQIQKIEALIQYLIGLVYHKLGNMEKAIQFFKKALQIDIFCYEAYETLIESHMLTSKEEMTLLNGLDFKGKCGEEAELVKALYTSKIKKLSDYLPELNDSFQKLQENYSLGENNDVLTSHSEALFYQCRFNECHEETSKILLNDPYHQSCLPLHIACLYELKMKNQLFILSHQLVDNYPEKAVTWFAIGVYYYLIGKNAEARKNFSKSTTIDSNFVGSWIGFGHCFAAENEHDPALSAYTTAARLFKGSHLPFLFMGMEQLKTNSISAADQYFKESHSLYPHDPLLMNEMGVCYFRKNNHKEAIRYFCSAIEIAEQNDSHQDLLKVCYVNIGHCYRKLKEFPAARNFFQKALEIDPHCASSLSALGFVYQLEDNLLEAIELFHKSLSIRCDDSLTKEMLSLALQDFPKKKIKFPEPQKKLIINQETNNDLSMSITEEHSEDEEEEDEEGEEEEDDDDDDMAIE